MLGMFQKMQRGQVAGGECQRGKWQGMMLERSVVDRSHRDGWAECHSGRI